MHRISTALAVTAVLILAAFTMRVPAQEPAQPPPLRIVDSVEVDLGPRSLFLDRVEAPMLRKPRRQSPPAREVVVLDAIPEEEATPEEIVMLSATVFDGRWTDLRWKDARGSWRAWSSFDFSLFSGPGLPSFESGGVGYTFLLGLGSESFAVVREWNDTVQREKLEPELAFDLPRLPRFTTGRAEYVVTESPAGETQPSRARCAPRPHPSASAANRTGASRLRA